MAAEEQLDADAIRAQLVNAAAVGEFAVAYVGTEDEPEPVLRLLGFVVDGPSCPPLPESAANVQEFGLCGDPRGPASVMWRVADDAVAVRSPMQDMWNLRMVSGGLVISLTYALEPRVDGLTLSRARRMAEAHVRPRPRSVRRRRG